MKQRLQGLIIGFMLATLLVGGITVAATNTRTIEVTYGVNIAIDGVRQSFADDMMPFMSGGRTFLPVRGIAEALGVDVTWDSATSTVDIISGTSQNQPPVQQPQPPTPGPAVLGFDQMEVWRGGFTPGIPANFVVRNEVVPITTNAIRVSASGRGRDNVSSWADYLLDGAFERFTGTLVAADGSPRSAFVSFWDISDESSFRLIGTFNTTVGNQLEIDIPLDGVQTLRIILGGSPVRNTNIYYSGNVALYNAGFHRAE